MVTTNSYTDSNSADYLNAIRQNQIDQRNANRSQESITLNWLIQIFNNFTFTNTVNIDSSTQTISNILNLSNSVTQTSQTTGTFLIDTAKIDFSDVA